MENHNVHQNGGLDQGYLCPMTPKTPLPLSTSISLMFKEHPLEARFGAARQAGFRGLEIQRIDEGEPAAMSAAAARAEVEVVLINLPLGDFWTGGPGLSGVPGREAEFRVAFEHGLEAARLLETRLIHLGPSRVPAGTDRTACLETYRRNVELALRLADGRELTLLAEPVNQVDFPGALLTDLDQTAALVADVGSDRFGLQFDIYHTAMSGLDPVAGFNAHAALVRHIQFSDAPGRHEPGTGSIDFPAMLAAIARSSYQGWIGAEYFPSVRTEETLGWRDQFEVLLRR
jgi:hydroxypyruvate isomerase